MLQTIEVHSTMVNDGMDSICGALKSDHGAAIEDMDEAIRQRAVNEMDNGNQPRRGEIL